MQTLEQLRDGSLAGARELKLACGLTEFPKEIFSLSDTLEVLDLSGNELTALPRDLCRLKKLKIIFCSNNKFVDLPAALGACPELSMLGFKANHISSIRANALPKKLRWLILTDNQIVSLPAEIGLCTDLQKLMLSGNQLSELPSQLASCRRLELLRISANQFAKIPHWVFLMPRLSWIAYNGNPMTAQLESLAMSNTRTRTLDWRAVSLDKKLGEGASGVISQASVLIDDERNDVAIKLFKGAITSDGLPESEMAACLSLMPHPHLTEIIAQLVNHPEGARGLLMRLISNKHSNLAGPPSFQTCTRDVYNPSLSFNASQVLKLAHGIVSGVTHLHRHGVLHGDVYAHNILYRNDGHAILGDFGAASLFEPLSEIADPLQKLEVRAFGCLLEELLERCDLASTQERSRLALQSLRDACLQEDPNQRPTFSFIEAAITAAMDYR
jgi:hypothetical protein